MSNRNLTGADVRNALTHAAAVRKSDADNRSDWTVRGPDLDGEFIHVALMVDESPPGWMEVVTAHGDGGEKKWLTMRAGSARPKEDEGNDDASNG